MAEAWSWEELIAVDLINKLITNIVQVIVLGSCRADDGQASGNKWIQLEWIAEIEMISKVIAWIDIELGLSEYFTKSTT